MVRSASNIESLEEIRRTFSTSYKCGLYLRRLRWPKGVTCPRCGAKHPGHISSRKLWQCRACRYQFSVTTGTIFHRSKIDLPRWFVAIWLMCNSPKGISAKQLERDLGVHYETAWYMAKRIRRAMKHDIFEDKLCGIVEIDDAVVKSDKGTRWEGGSYVLGMASRSGDIKLQILNKLKGEEVRRVVAENVDYVKSFYTDGHKLYRKMHELGPHQYVVHQKQWVDGEVHVSFVENAWSLFKRGLVGMYHHVSTKYLQEYLDEFAFRYSHRNEKPKLLDLVLASCSC
ncbi:IS1595 family transposase [Candidatus Bipolaricaulota bacterium]